MENFAREEANHLIRIDNLSKNVKKHVQAKQNKRGYLAKQTAMKRYQRKLAKGQATYDPSEPSIMDAYFSKACDYGMTEVVQFKNGEVWASQFYKQSEAGALYEYLQGKDDVYITPFKYQPNTAGHFNRKANQMSQITALVLDIDTYKSTLLDDEKNITLSNINDNLLEDVDGMVDAGILPAYNYANVSHGVQLVYIIKGGMAAKSFPYLKELQGYLNRALKVYGADSSTSDAARLTRAPYTINTKTGEPIPVKTITGSMDYLAWNGKDGYNEWRLKLSKLYTKKTPKTVEEKVNRYKTFVAHFSANQYILKDLELLFANRIDNTGNRHNGLYDYAYRTALVNGTADLKTITHLINERFISYVNGLDDKDIERTITDAFNDANHFIESYAKNGNTVIVKANDGIKKPRKVKNMVDRFNITEAEMRNYGLRSLCTAEIKHEHHKEIDKIGHRKANGRIVSKNGKYQFKYGDSQADRTKKQKMTENMRIAMIKGSVKFKPKKVTIKDMLDRLGMVIDLGTSSLKKLKQKALSDEYRNIKAISRGKVLRLIYHELLKHRDALAFLKGLFNNLSQASSIQDVLALVNLMHQFLIEFLTKNGVEDRYIMPLRGSTLPNLAQ